MDLKKLGQSLFGSAPNRWQPEADQLARFLLLRDLQGVLSKDLYIPDGSMAWIRDDRQAQQLGPGTHAVGGTLFQRLNQLFQDRHVEILILRTLPLPLRFDDLEVDTAEFLRVKVSLELMVQADFGRIENFMQHFMRVPGVVDAAQLQLLLRDSLRQILAEFFARHGMRELAAMPDLRAELDRALQQGLVQRFASFGLAIDSVSVLAVRHEKLDALRRQQGELWLVGEEGRIGLDHQRLLDELYDQDAWREVQRVAKDIRAKLALREAQLGGEDSAAQQDSDQVARDDERALRDAERRQGVREREVDLYQRIARSATRQEAIGQEAAEEIARLEHELLHQGLQRESEQDEWEQVRRLAEMRRLRELQLVDLERKEAGELEQRRIAHRLAQLQLVQASELARLTEDEELKAVQHEALLAIRQAQAREAAEIGDMQHQLALDTFVRERHLKDAAAEIEIRMLQEGADADVRRARRAEDVDQAQTQEEIDRIRRHATAEQRDRAHFDALQEHELRQLQQKLELAGEDARSVIAERRDEAAHKRKLAEMDGARQAANDQLDRHRGLTPEQILAGQGSALAVDALAQIAKANAAAAAARDQSAREMQLMDQLRADREAADTRLDRAYERALGMAEKAVDASHHLAAGAQRDLGQAAQGMAGAMGPAQVHLPGAVPVAPGPTVMQCPHCGSTVPAYPRCTRCNQPLAS